MVVGQGVSDRLHASAERRVAHLRDHLLRDADRRTGFAATRTM